MSDSMKTRDAFTLVELLVVMALIAALATLAIAFLPNAASAQRESRAAQMLQGWLNIAKQRAMRDQAPRGLRLWINAQYYVGGSNVPLPWVVTDCQYIEQPDDFPSSLSVTLMSGSPTNAAALNKVMVMPFGQGILVNGNLPLNAAQTKYWSVQPDDYLEVLGTGQMHRITQVGVVNANGTLNADYFAINPPLTTPLTTATTNWRIVRAPRVVGDETLKMPDFTVIDLNTNLVTYVGVQNAALPSIIPFTDPSGAASNTDIEVGGYVDILFAPNGAVISRGVSTSQINLWVRCPAENNPNGALAEFRGDPTIVSVFVRTGFVGAFPPDPNAVGNPYTFVK